MMFVEENGTIRTTLISGSEAAAQNLIVTVTLPVSFTYVSSDPAGVVAGNVVTFTFAEFAADGLQLLNVVAKPTIEGAFTSAADVSSLNPSTPGSVTYDEVEHEVFDRRACVVIGITSPNGFAGGGNTFDCLDDGPYSVLPLTGTGFTAFYFGDSPFGYVYGEEFEDYAEGAYAGGTPGASVTGFTEIFVGDGP